jgi:hypothetical protein
MEDIMNYQEGSDENSNCQVGNEMRSSKDIIDCQEGRSEIPNFQVGKGDKMRLSESLKNSKIGVSISKEC